MNTKAQKEYKTYSEVAERLSQIVEQARAKDTSLEQALDLFDEAIELEALAIDLVDTTEFSAEERKRLEQQPSTEDVNT